MSRLHLPSTSRALYRVFIASTFPPQTPLLLPRATLLFPQTPTRSVHFKKDTQRHALSDHFTFNNAIEASYINYVDVHGVFQANVHISDALRSFNKVTHYLLLISPSTADEFGQSDPTDLPTCKVISKIDLRAQHEKKVEIARRAAKGKGSGPDPKNMELNWAIAGGDLKHRLSKLQDLLREARKVEVMIGPKRKGRQATEKECQDLVKQVRVAVDEVRGAGEAREPEGAMGGVMTFVFEGRDLGEGKDKQGHGERPKGEDKKKRKEREEMKERRRLKAAEEDRRNKLGSAEVA